MRYYRRTPHINEFPEEVLLNILLFVLSPSSASTRIKNVEDIPVLNALTEDTPVVSFNVQTSPFPLSQVCCLWRKVVTMKSSFWFSIAVVEPSEKHLHRMRLWMERAGSQRLEIQVYQYSNPSEEKRTRLNAVFKILCTRTRQWWSLLIKVDEYIPQRLLSNELPFTNLREATVFLGPSVHVKTQEPGIVCTLCKAFGCSLFPRRSLHTLRCAPPAFASWY